MATVKVGGAIATAQQKEEFREVMGLLSSSDSPEVSFISLIPTAERAAIIARTSTYDCRTALAAAIASRAYGTGLNASGATVEFANGAYDFGGEIPIKTKCALIGSNSGLGGAAAVEFRFPAESNGIVVYGPGNIGNGKDEPPTNGGDGTLLSGLKLVGGGYSSAGDGFHGVKMRARTKCVGVLVTGFRGDGFHPNASEITDNDAEFGNANLFYLDTCSAVGNWGSGLYSNGRDANAGQTTLFNGKENGRWCIWDSSFLGNSHYTAHASANGRRAICHYQGVRYYVISDTLGGLTTPGTDPAVWVAIGSGGTNTLFLEWVPGGAYITGGPYKSDDANARTAFIGCYSEPGNQPPSSVMYPAHVIGGHQEAGFTPESTGFMILGNKVSKHWTKNSDGGEFHVARNSNEFYAIKSPGDSAVGYAMMTSSATKTLQLRHARFDNRVAIEHTTDNSTFFGGRTDPVGPGFSNFPRGVYIDDRFVDYGAAPPTTGQAGRGDIRFNLEPSAGEPVLWQATTGGTNGDTAVWTPFGSASGGPDLTAEVDALEAAVAALDTEKLGSDQAIGMTPLVGAVQGTDEMVVIRSGVPQTATVAALKAFFNDTEITPPPPAPGGGGTAVKGLVHFGPGSYGTTFAAVPPASMANGDQMVLVVHSSNAFVSASPGTWLDRTPASWLVGDEQKQLLVSSAFATPPASITMTMAGSAAYQATVIAVSGVSTGAVGGSGNLSGTTTTGDERTHPYTTTAPNSIVVGGLDWTGGGVTGSTAQDSKHTWDLPADGDGYSNGFAGLVAASGSHSAEVSSVGGFSNSLFRWAEVLAA